MNTVHFSIRKQASILVALSLLGFAIPAAATEVPQAIHVIQVKGQARYSSDHKTWQKLKAGDLLKPGALMQTAENSAVDLLLGDHDLPAGSAPAALEADGNFPMAGQRKENVVHLTANSVLGIDKLTCDRTEDDEASETQLDLRDGQIIGRFGQPSPGSKFEIKFARGVAGVRQGIYAITSSGAVRVSSGAVVIAETLDGTSLVTKMVNANQVFDPRTGLVTQVPPGEIKKPQADPQPSPARAAAPDVPKPDFREPLRKF